VAAQPRDADRARLFFALWPDDAVRKHLATWAGDAQAQCGGRQVRAENMHLTLFFVGEVGRTRIPALETLASTMRGASFELDMNTLGYWRHNRLVWAGATRCPDALSELVAGLREALSRLDIREEERRYVPHVTLVRDAARPPRNNSLSGFAWHAAEFVLVESVREARASRYDVIYRSPLVA
jgi:2'-5' RNA ligase